MSVPSLAVAITGVGGAANQAARTVSGTATVAAGASVTIMQGTASLGSALVTAKGAWTTSVVLPDEGLNTLVAVESSAGGQRATSAAATATLDRTPPQLAITTASGKTAATVQLVTGTIDAADADRVVRVVDNGTVSTTAVVSADGTWSARVALGQGANVLVAASVDAAGNAASSASITLVVPAAPSGGRLSSFTPLATATGGTYRTASSCQVSGRFALHGSTILSNAGRIFQTASSAIGDTSGAKAVLMNQASGTYTIGGDYSVGVGSNADSYYDNAGTLVKSAGLGTSTIAANFTNQSNANAAIVVASGTLAFAGRQSKFVHQAISGAGTLMVSGGTATIGAGTTIETAGFGLQGSGTTLKAAEAFRINGSFVDRGATTLDLGGQNVRLAGSTIFSSDATGAPTITGTGNLTSSGFATLGDLAVSGSARLINTGVLTQTGTLRLGDTSASVAGLANSSGSVWRLAGNADIDVGGSHNVLENSDATIVKTGGRSTIAAAITNTSSRAGMIDVASGTLELKGEITGAQSLQVDDGATLILDTPASSAAAFSFGSNHSALELTSSRGFAGQIAHFGEGRSIDLDAFASKSATLTYAAQASSGILTVTDGTSTTALHFMGSFALGNFRTSDDGHGGTLLSFGHA